MSVNTGLLSASRPRSERLRWKALTIAGLLLFAGGMIQAPVRVAPSLLLYGYLVLGLAIGGLYFLAIHHAAGATWAAAIKRPPEALSTLFPAALAIILVAWLLGAETLYPWLHAEEAATLAPFKAWWLRSAFFFARAGIYAAVLYGFGWALRRASRAQDRDRDPRHTVRMRKLAAAFLVVGSFVVWLVSFDWIMSLEPHWYSTLFGVYHFAGHFTGALAAVILMVVVLERRGNLPGVSRHHLHDLGKLLFAMCTFWMYMWFSQAMLIWYSNLAEEAVYYGTRLGGGWRPLFFANVLLNWAIPFLVLLSRRAKRSPAVLARIAIVVLVGRWLDLYLMIYPPISADLVFGLLEAGGALASVGLVGFLVFRWLKREPAVSTGDPSLEESLHHGSS